MNSPALQNAHSRAIDGMRAYVETAEGDRTIAIRQIATALVDGREHFYTKDGDVDWTGRTYAYRMWVRDVTAEANVPPEQRTTLQGAVRYHTGTMLRARLSAEQIEALGLRSESPRERSIERRDAASKTLSLFGSGGGEIRAAEDILAVIATVEATLRRIPSDAAATLDSSTRAGVRQALARSAERFAQ